ncbi:hypothetical protein K501DRAFT_278996 [Backusella circina FSU 941]|nr:hypothetical protein K501DRAFT_278996 [Backusella circina FSU 941]
MSLNGMFQKKPKSQKISQYRIKSNRPKKTGPQQTSEQTPVNNAIFTNNNSDVNSNSNASNTASNNITSVQTTGPNFIEISTIDKTQMLDLKLASKIKHSSRLTRILLIQQIKSQENLNMKHVPIYTRTNWMDGGFPKYFKNRYLPWVDEVICSTILVIYMKLLKTADDCPTFHLIYCIIYKLKPSLKKYFPGLMKKAELSLPILHAYAHFKNAVAQKTENSENEVVSNSELTSIRNAMNALIHNTREYKPNFERPQSEDLLEYFQSNDEKERREHLIYEIYIRTLSVLLQESTSKITSSLISVLVRKKSKCF